MKAIYYIDRTTQEKKLEKVYGEKALLLLYGKGVFSRLLGPCLRFISARLTCVSRLYGWWQKQRWTKRKIEPFVEQYHIDAGEFLKPISAYHSFNEFFTRKLKAEARPITQGEDVAIIPADGRYFAYPDVSRCSGIFVKGQCLSLKTLLGSDSLAKEYAQATVVIGRLCPVDYHRFHFPTHGVPGKASLINGALFSVNPIALKKNIHIFSENKRKITSIQNTPFGQILFIEVGATNVGSIRQTYTPEKPISKGEEKGYFSFGGSALILLFPKNTCHLSRDIVKNTESGFETLCKMGEPLGFLT